MLFNEEITDGSINQPIKIGMKILVNSYHRSRVFVVKGVSGIHIEDSDRYGLRSLNPFEPLLGTLSLETMTRHGAFLRR